MKKYYLAAACLGVVLLTGCTTVNSAWSQRYLFDGSSSASIQQMNAQQLYAVPSNDLCAAYSGTMSPLIKDEIQRRGLIINQDNWTNVTNSKTWTGMTLCQLLASQGKPDTVVKGQTMIELDYSATAYQVENGEVTRIAPVTPAK